MKALIDEKIRIQEHNTKEKKEMNFDFKQRQDTMQNMIEQLNAELATIIQENKNNATLLKREKETVNFLKSEMSSKLLKFDLQKEHLENTLNNNKQEAEAKISELSQNLDLTSSRVESLSKEISNAMMEREKELVRLRLEHHKQIAEMKGKAEEESEKNLMLKKEIEALNEAISILEATKEKLNFDLEGLQNESDRTISAFTETVEEFDSKLNQFEHEKDAQQNQMNALQQELLELNTVLAQNKIVIELGDQNNKTYQNLIEKKAEEFNVCKYASESQNFLQLEEIKKLEEKLRELTEQLNSAIETIENTSKMNSELQRLTVELKLEGERKSASLVELESQNQKLIGHSNPKQKVHQDIKKENNELKTKNTELIQKYEKLNVLYKKQAADMKKLQQPKPTENKENID